MRPPPRSPLFPYTTLFRSLEELVARERAVLEGVRGVLGLLQVLLIEALAIDDEDAARVQIPDIHLEGGRVHRSEEHTSELQSHHDLVCRLLLEKKNNNNDI